MEITGKIIEVLPVREGTSANGTWKSQSYVIDTEGMDQYPKKMLFDVFDGTVGRIARLNIQSGKTYRVFFDISARKAGDRWFNSITAYDAREFSTTQSANS